VSAVLKLAVMKPGTRLHWAPTAGVGPGEAMSICRVLAQGGVEVHVFTTLAAQDTLHPSLKWHDVRDSESPTEFDALLVINGKVQPGAAHAPERQYDFINSFNGPVFYALCDPELPLMNVGDCRIHRDDITVLCQAFDVAGMRARWVGTEGAVQIGGMWHVPFEQFPLCFTPWLHSNARPTVDLIYGGSDRGGRRVRNLHKWYFGLPPDISVELFGKIDVDDFTRVLGQVATETRAPTFTPAVPYGEIRSKLNTAFAHLVIGDESYQQLNLVPQRVYEAISAGCVTFIDSAMDDARRVYEAGIARDFLYVDTQAQLVERLRLLKNDQGLHRRVVQSGLEDAHRLKSDFANQLVRQFRSKEAA
jgi:hypothetical protein